MFGELFRSLKKSSKVKKLTKEYFNYRMVNKIIPAHKIIQNEIKKLLWLGFL